MAVQGVGQESYGMVRQGMQGSSSGSSEVTALQRLAAAGSEPLLAVGRALGAHLVHSLGSTTSVALTGGLSLIRLGVGTHSSSLHASMYSALYSLCVRSACHEPVVSTKMFALLSEA